MVAHGHGVELVGQQFLEREVQQRILQDIASKITMGNFATDSQLELLDVALSPRVPVLRLKRYNLHIDLSIQNIQPMLNTRLLQEYASLDPLIRDLGVAVKVWAAQHHLLGARQGNLSSYAFVLMSPSEKSRRLQRVHGWSEQTHA